jgi:hypothetical protein
MQLVRYPANCLHACPKNHCLQQKLRTFINTGQLFLHQAPLPITQTLTQTTKEKIRQNRKHSIMGYWQCQHHLNAIKEGQIGI